jgi:repressor LexA
MPALATRPLTQRQRALLDFLYAYTLAHGYQPSARDILDHMGLASLNGYNRHMRVLARAGYIRLAGKRGRGVQFVLWPDGEPFRGFARPPLESVTTPEGD